MFSLLFPVICDHSLVAFTLTLGKQDGKGPNQQVNLLFLFYNLQYRLLSPPKAGLREAGYKLHANAKY